MWTPTGTVIHGTLRKQDLNQAFCEWLDYYRNDAFLDIVENYGDSREDLIMDGDNDDEWLLEALLEAIGECMPDGYYFGAHVGDGSDFGIWPIDDDYA